MQVLLSKSRLFEKILVLYRSRHFAIERNNGNLPLSDITSGLLTAGSHSDTIRAVVINSVVGKAAAMMTQELTVKAENFLAVSTEFFGDKAIEEFINSRSANANTQSKYRRIIRQVLKNFAAQKITAPVEDDVNRYIVTLRAQKKSDYTIRLYATVMKSFFSFLGRKGYYADIAADVKVSLKKSKTHNRKALTQKQAERLISAINGTDEVSRRNRAIIALSLTTGVRTVEIERADVEDLSEADGYWALKVQGKGRLTKDETVKVVPWVAQMILSYLALRGDGGRLGRQKTAQEVFRCGKIF